ncbi:MAG: class I SAM-dependent RNA methyltransferase [Polyangiaceae bacterium]|nr:class I SAM-dependent RNA methyltransferase [Polyangiaceae bacterium]
MKPETWVIERLVPGGDGMSRLGDGRVGFASETAPGDRLRVLEVEDRRQWVRATKWELLEGGPQRVTPACRYATECGGCDFMHLSDAGQLAAKRELLTQALTRTGKLAPLPEPIEIEPSPARTGYRSRLRVHVDRRGEVGLYAKASHALVPIEQCLVSSDAVNAGLAQLRGALRQHTAAARLVAEVEIRSSALAPQLLFALRGHAEVAGNSQPLGALLAALAPHPAVLVSEHGAADVVQHHALGDGVTLQIEPAAFAQVNWGVNLALVEALCGGVEARGARRFLDLYAGAGNFTLPLLARGLSGIAVELDGAAIRSARRAATAQGLDPKVFRSGDVRRVLPRLEKRLRFEVVIVDPPRRGAGELLHEISALGARAVAYVGCDPVTLARDVGALCRQGYRLESVRGFDMFPHTHHFETLAWLAREAGGGA